MKLKESKERHLGGFGERKGEEDTNTVIIISRPGGHISEHGLRFQALL